MNKKQSRFLSLFFTFLILFSFIGEVGAMIQTNNLKDEIDIESEFDEKTQKEKQKIKEEIDLEEEKNTRETDSLFKYREDDKGNIVITGLNKEIIKITIPETIEGKKVIGIDKHSFQKKGIEEVILGENIEFIDDYAFADNEINNLVLNKNLKEIGKYGFRDNKIEKLDLRETNVNVIREGSFMLNNLRELYLPDLLTNIEDYSFKDNSLKSVTIPNNVVNFGKEIFAFNKQYVEILGNNSKIKTEKVNQKNAFGHVVDIVNITVKHIDEDDNEIMKDTVFKNDFTKEDGIYTLGEFFTYTNKDIKGYQIIEGVENVKLTDKEMVFTIKYKYTGVAPKIVFKEQPDFKEGQIVGEEELLDLVVATDLNGKDITNNGSLVVSPKTIEFESLNDIKTVEYRIKDDFGNEGIFVAKLFPGMDYMKYPIGDGWVLGDFRYANEFPELDEVSYLKGNTYNTVIGLSKQGYEKSKTRRTLVLPTINPFKPEEEINRVGNIKETYYSTIKDSEGSEIKDKFVENKEDATIINNIYEKYLGNKKNNLKEIEDDNSKDLFNISYVNNNITKIKNLDNIEYIYSGVFENLNLVEQTELNLNKLKEIHLDSFGETKIFIEQKELNFENLTHLSQNTFTGHIKSSTLETISFPKLKKVHMVDERRMSKILSIIDTPNLREVNLPELEYVDNDSFFNFVSDTKIEILNLPKLKKNIRGKESPFKNIFSNGTSFLNNPNSEFEEKPITFYNLREINIPELESVSVFFENIYTPKIEKINAPKLKYIYGRSFDLINNAEHKPVDLFIPNIKGIFGNSFVELEEIKGDDIVFENLIFLGGYNTFKNLRLNNKNKILLPELKVIGSGLFSYDDDINKPYFDYNNETFLGKGKDFKNTKYLKELNLNSLEIIEGGAFSYFYIPDYITEIELPSLKLIGDKSLRRTYFNNVEKINLENLILINDEALSDALALNLKEVYAENLMYVGSFLNSNLNSTGYLYDRLVNGIEKPDEYTLTYMPYAFDKIIEKKLRPGENKLSFSSNFNFFSGLDMLYLPKLTFKNGYSLNLHNYNNTELHLGDKLTKEDFIRTRQELNNFKEYSMDGYKYLYDETKGEFINLSRDFLDYYGGDEPETVNYSIKILSYIDYFTDYENIKDIQLFSHKANLNTEIKVSNYISSKEDKILKNVYTNKRNEFRFKSRNGEIKQGFVVQELEGKNIQTKDSILNIYIQDEKGNLVNPRNNTDLKDVYIVNPSVVYIDFLDEEGNQIKQSEIVNLSTLTNRQFKLEKYYEEYTLKEDKDVLDLSKAKEGERFKVIYEKIDYKNEDFKTEGIELDIDRGVQDKKEFKIGEDMLSRVKFNITGFNMNIKEPILRVYFEDNIDITDLKISGLDNSLVKNIEKNREDNFIDIKLNKDNIGGTQFNITLYGFKFKEFISEYGIKGNIKTLLLDGNKPLQSSNTIEYSGIYDKPGMNIYVQKYSFNYHEEDIKNGERDFGSIEGLSDNKKERVGKEKDITIYFDTVNQDMLSTIKRNVNSYNIKVDLPDYVKIEDSGKERLVKAKFDKNKNPGWILKDNQLIYNSEIFKGTHLPEYPELKLTFPHIKNGYQVELKSNMVLNIDNKTKNETDFNLYSDIKIYPSGQYYPKPTGEIHFGKWTTLKPNYDGNTYIYDNIKDRTKNIPYEITFGARNDTIRFRNVKITDFKLDDRLYFDSLTLPKVKNQPVTVKAYKRIGNKIDPTKDTLLDAFRVVLDREREVNFTSKDIDYFQVEFNPEFAIDNNNGKQYSMFVNTKLKNPEEKLYGENNQMYNKAVLSGNTYNAFTGALRGKRGDLRQVIGGVDTLISKYDEMWDNIPGTFFWEQEAHVDIKEAVNNYSVKKTQKFEVYDKINGLDYKTKDNSTINYESKGNYLIYLDTNDIDLFEDFKNIKVVDLIPEELEVTNFYLAEDVLKKGDNVSLEYIENYKDGLDAVVFKADTLDIDTSELFYIDVIVNSDILGSTTIKNEVEATWDNKHIYKDGIKNREISRDDIRVTLLTDETVIAKKYIRNLKSEWQYNIITKSDESFEYKLEIENKTSQDRKDLVLIDVFPYEDDISIQELNPGTNNRPLRESEFSNKIDIGRLKEMKIPEGYKVSYYNKPISDYNNLSADDYFASIEWSTEPSEKTTAIKIEAEEGTVLKPQDKIEFIIPMKAPLNNIDNNFNLTGKKAYNTFIRKADDTERFLEPNRVYNEMLGSKGSIEFVKYGKEGLNNKDKNYYTLEGASFTLKDKEGNNVKTVLSNKDGLVKFEDIDIQEYVIIENLPPKNYLKSKNIETITLDDFRAVEKDNYKLVLDLKEEFLNIKPIEGVLKIEKQDNNNNNITGVMFDIEGLDEYNKDFKTSIITDNKGRAELKLKEGRYKITERSYKDTPGLISTKPIEINIDSQGKIYDFTGENSIVNNEANIIINKLGVNSNFDIETDIKDIESWKYNKLTGFAFDITDSKGNKETVKVNDEGFLMYTAKLNETYTIKENQKESIENNKYTFNDKEYTFKVIDKGIIVSKDGERFKENAVNIPNKSKPYEGNITLTKKSTKGDLLEGVKFGLYDYNSNNLIEEKTTNSKGELNFTNIPEGLYRLKELETIDGYVADFTDKIIVINESSMSFDSEDILKDKIVQHFHFDATNTELEVSFTKGELLFYTNINDAINIVKENPDLKYRVNGNIAEIYKPLSGVEFDFYEGEDKVKTYITKEDGSIDFGDFKFKGSETYKLIETKTQEGYKLDKTPIYIDIVNDFKQKDFTGVYDLFFNNEKETGNIYISKYDKTDNRKLEGVEFTLYKEKVDETNIVEVKETDASGYIDFNNLELNTKYIVKETKALEGYELLETEFEFTPTSKDTNKLYIIYNELEGPKEFKITLNKKDGITNENLSGAEFTLYNNKDLVISTGISDENGLVVFEELNIELSDEGLYIKETKAPKGYQLNTEVKHITENMLDEDNVIDLGVFNNFKNDIPNIIDTGGFATKTMLIVTLLLLTTYVFINKKKTNI